MTVRALTGKVDDHDVVFTQIETGQWTCVVPFTTSGKYVIELYAVDDAGNTSYYAKALFIVDTDKLTASLSIIDYVIDLQNTLVTSYVGQTYNALLVSNIRC